MTNRSPEVDAWMESYDNPLKPLVQAVRAVILDASLPDPTGLLEGDGDTSRVVRFADSDDLAAKSEALRGLVAAWIVSRE